MAKEDLTVLYVDDEKVNLKIFELTFKKDYNIITCNNSRKALSILKKMGEIPVIITDQRMPHMTGVELLEESLSISPDSVRILLTAYSDTGDLLNAINKGRVFSYLVKPWKEVIVRTALKEAFDKYFMVKENKRLVSELINKVGELKNTQKQLMEAQGKLINQGKRVAIGNLAAGLSHEVKNQLIPISLLDFLRDEVSEEGIKIINQVNEGCKRIVGLIDEIRALSKGEEPNYSIQSMAVTKVIEESVFLSKLDPDVKPIKISLDHQYKGSVMMDKNKIIQVLLNLIRNAAHAVSKNENAVITLKTERNGRFAILHIIDNGIGIEKDTLMKIWEPFFTTKGENGTGIGLDIVRRIIEGHHGTISCLSEPNEGSVFTFTLPLPDNELKQLVS